MIPFSKMQGAANDFIVVDNRELALSASQLSALAKQACQRKFSVGADAVMAVDTPEKGGDFRMRFYNADGTEAEMCGNGARCIARYAYEKGLAQAEMTIETVAGPVKAWRLDSRLYKIQLNPATVVKEQVAFELTDGSTITASYVELGDPGIPHTVVYYPGLAETELSELKEVARELRYHPSLSKGANVNFYDILPAGGLIHRTYERGVEDFTFACGTGAGSTALIATLTKEISQPVSLQVLGGKLQVEIGAHQELYLIGDTNIVALGELVDEDLTL